MEPLLDAIWKAGLILVGDRVRQEYGLSTPIFIDLRHRLYDEVGLLQDLGQALHRKIAALVGAAPTSELVANLQRAPTSEFPANLPGTPTAARVQQVLGIPDTATPLALAAAMVSLETPVPLHYCQLRKRPAAYPGGGSGLSAFMGTWREDRELTLIDDVMASGRSKLWAIEELARNQIPVTRILVVVDREQGGDRILAERGYPVHSLWTLSEVLDYFVRSGKVESSTAREALDHLHSKQFR